MPRAQRRQCEADIYHVTQRGTAQCDIFLDDDDRRYFLRSMRDAFKEAPAGSSVLAWCLMGNHVHILCHMDLEALAATMRRLFAGYALYFNKKHNRVGALFQGRFGSVPVETDEQLMQVVRYIHQNPMRAGIAPSCAYHWSSYSEYVEQRWICDCEYVMGYFAGLEEFVEFHRMPGSSYGIDVGSNARHKVSDEQAAQIAENLLAPLSPSELGGLPKKDRDALVARLRGAGLAIRQIESMTGLSRNIVARCGRK